VDASERLIAARESLQRASASLGDLAAERSGVDLAAARDAVDSALKATEEFVGECQEAVPFAPTFLAFEDNRAVWKCTHTPAHVFPV
jgi:hypothetical protein